MRRCTSRPPECVRCMHFWAWALCTTEIKCRSQQQPAKANGPHKAAASALCVLAGHGALADKEAPTELPTAPPAEEGRLVMQCSNGSSDQLIDGKHPSSISIHLQQVLRQSQQTTTGTGWNLKTLSIVLQAQGRSSPIWDRSKLIQEAATRPWRTAWQLPRWHPPRARQRRLKPSTSLPSPLCSQGRQRQGR